MKRRRQRYAVFTSVIVLLACGAAADEAAPELRHNPFSRPPSERTISARDIGLGSSVVPSAIALQATMVAGSNKLANVGGRILRPGDEIQGYSLQQVFEDRAVFSREGKQLTVYVKPERAAEDD